MTVFCVCGSRIIYCVHSKEVSIISRFFLFVTQRPRITERTKKKSEKPKSKKRRMISKSLCSKSPRGVRSIRVVSIKSPHFASIKVEITTTSTVLELKHRILEHLDRDDQRYDNMKILFRGSILIDSHRISQAGLVKDDFEVHLLEKIDEGTQLDETVLAEFLRDFRVNSISEFSNDREILALLTHPQSFRVLANLCETDVAVRRFSQSLLRDRNFVKTVIGKMKTDQLTRSEVMNLLPKLSGVGFYLTKENTPCKRHENENDIRKIFESLCCPGDNTEAVLIANCVEVTLNIACQDVQSFFQVVTASSKVPETTSLQGKISNNGLEKSNIEIGEFREFVAENESVYKEMCCVKRVLEVRVRCFLALIGLLNFKISQPSQYYNTRAVEYMRQTQFKDAVREFTHAIEFCGNEKETFFLNAMKSRNECYLKLKMFNECVEQCSRIIALNKGDVQMYCQLQKAYNGLGDVAKVLSYSKFVVLMVILIKMGNQKKKEEIDESGWLLQVLKSLSAQLNKRMGQKEDYLRTLTAQEFKSFIEDEQKHRAETIMKSSENIQLQTTDMLELYSAILHRIVDPVGYYFGLGVRDVSLNKYREAVAFFTRALGFSRSKTELGMDAVRMKLLKNRASCYLILKDLDRCLLDFTRVLRHNPNDYDVCERIILLYAQKNDLWSMRKFCNIAMKRLQNDKALLEKNKEMYNQYADDLTKLGMMVYKLESDRNRRDCRTVDVDGVNVEIGEDDEIGCYPGAFEFSPVTEMIQKGRMEKPSSEVDSLVLSESSGTNLSADE